MGIGEDGESVTVEPAEEEILEIISSPEYSTWAPERAAPLKYTSQFFALVPLMPTTFPPL